MSDNESSPVTTLASTGTKHPTPVQPAGDRARLSAIFEAEYARVVGFIVARCGSPSVAEDVVSDVFTDAARLAAQGRVEEVDRSWLFMVARRRLIDFWRSDERHRRRLEKLRLRRPEQNHTDALHDQHLLDALQALPTRQRAALTLRYLDEYSVSEIAEALDVSYRAAESLLSRARASFATSYRGVFDE